MNGSVRIIGGKWKGRKLLVLDKKGLRPTTDRVKETLFNWLMPITQDAICLDCFSGTGSLGFEAASRGAKHVVFLEKEGHSVKQLLINKQQIKPNNIDIYHCDTVEWLHSSANIQFNLVFIDPPFHQSLIEKTVAKLEEHNWLAKSAYIYIESEIHHLVKNAIPHSWRLHREKITGQVHSYLFIREI